MSARETIASVMWHNMPTAVSMNTVSKTADAVLSALAKDGYRLLGPDELDPVTVERCAQTAYWQARNGATADQIATTLRLLTGNGNG